MRSKDRVAPEAAVRAAHRLSFASSALGACRSGALASEIGDRSVFE
jgi:hypothetical protein